MVSGPVLHPGLHDLQFKWKKAFKQPRACFWGVYAIKHSEKARALGRGLVEEPQAS